ncbi:MAG: hypothetical protein WCV68_03775 [Candidatus Paceibacterota bacterium]|jgi:hypothetical protein
MVTIHGKFLHLEDNETRRTYLKVWREEVRKKGEPKTSLIVVRDSADVRHIINSTGVEYMAFDLLLSTHHL